MTPDEILTRVRELWTLLQRERETSKRYHVLAKEIRHLADAYKAAEHGEATAPDESWHGRKRTTKRRRI